MTPKFINKEDQFGFKKGEFLEENPLASGFFRRWGSKTGYVYLSPYTVVEHKETTTQESKGIKDDSGKTQWWYMDNFWPDLEQVADVLTYGDSKYPAEDGANWKRLDNPAQRLCDALLRHVLKYRYESKEDSETGKSHLAHAITNALMLMYFDRNKKGN